MFVFQRGRGRRQRHLNTALLRSGAASFHVAHVSISPTNHQNCRWGCCIKAARCMSSSLHLMPTLPWTDGYAHATAAVRPALHPQTRASKGCCCDNTRHCCATRGQSRRFGRWRGWKKKSTAACLDGVEMLAFKHAAYLAGVSSPSPSRRRWKCAP